MNRNFKFFIFILIYSLSRSLSAIDKKFAVVIPSYKNAAYYKKNLDSVFKQTYKNYRVIYIDDCSPDFTGNLVEKYVELKKQQYRFTLIKNKRRQLALANIYRAVLLCEDNEIVVMLDGDDEFAHENVLSHLNKVYQNENIWITYGNFKYLSNNSPCDYDPSFPEFIIKENKFREFRHGLTHLRTFYSWLFKQIKISDLFFEDSFFKMTYDTAIFVPMIEMAGYRHKFIHEVLYIYNDNNPINDHKVCMSLQHYLNRFIRQKTKYQKLETSKINFLNEFDNSKVDVMVFSNDYEQVEQLAGNLKNCGKIYLICDLENEPNKDKNDNIIKINKNILSPHTCTQILGNIFDNGSQYIMFFNENFNYEGNLDLNAQIKNLELTKSFALYFGHPDIQNGIQIMENISAFKYFKARYVNNIFAGLYRKQDIKNLYNSFERLELEWRCMGWNEICLFKSLEKTHA